MKVGDLVKIKKGTHWRNTTLPSTGIIVEVIAQPSIPAGADRELGGERYRIHTGEKFFARDLELLYSAASWSP